MKVAKRFGMLLVALCILVSSLSFTTAFADDGDSASSDIFAQVSGTYTADKTQSADNWHILKWLTDKPVFQAGANLYIIDGVKYNYMWPTPGANGELDKPFSYVTGGVPEGSAITSFTIDSGSANNAAFLKVYAASSLYAADDEWVELTISKSETISGTTGNLNLRLSYTMSAGKGYRYIKVVNTPVKTGEPWYAALGAFGFNWETNPFGGASGSYTADITKNADNWHILKWLTDKAYYATDKYDYYTGEGDAQVRYNFMKPQEATGDDTIAKPFTYVTGGVPAGSAITSFAIDASADSYDKFLKVYAASSLDAADDEWTELKISANTSNGKSGRYLTRCLTYTMSSENGYRYIKVVNTPLSKSAYRFPLGGFSFNWKTNPFEKVSGNYTADISKNADNWHILKWLTDKAYYATDKTDYYTVEGDTKVLYNFMKPKEGDTCGIPFTYVTGGVPEGSAITSFAIDASKDSYDKFLKVYAASSLDAADGEWTELSSPVVTDNGKSGNFLTKRLTYTTSAENGYRYIKVVNTPLSKSVYRFPLGGFSFDWQAVASATVDYSYNSSTKELSATVKLYNQPEVNPFIVLAGYNGEQLKSVSYREIGTVSGTKTFNYKIDAFEITSARVYLWDAATYAPIETFASYTAN